MTNVNVLTGSRQFPSEDYVSCDQVTIVGDGTIADPLHLGDGFAGSFDGVLQTSVLAGTAIAHHTGTDPISIGKCAGNAAVQCIGLATTDGVPGAVETVKYSGILTLPIEKWNLIAGTLTGLSGGVLYYVSQTTPGFLTDTAPTTGQHSIQVGVGLNATQMFLTISPPTVAP